MERILDLSPPRWEECGRRCHEHETCLAWAYNHGYNGGGSGGAGSGQSYGEPHECRFFKADMGWPGPNDSWITGKESCHRSDQCNGRTEMACQKSKTVMFCERK